MSELYPWLVPTYHKISQTFSEGLGHHALSVSYTHLTLPTTSRV